jgi:predicted DNA binding CopG/RHH family protein
MKKYRLDQEEREILAAIENGQWDLVRPKKFELRRYEEIAKNTLKKDQRMNIRISKMDLQGIKAKAAEEGVPYQTLVSSIIHKYIVSFR